jgi:cyclase
MNRRNFIQTTGLTLGTLALSGKELLANMFAENPYKMRGLRGGVGVFTERGGTIAYLTTKKGIAVVDSQFPEQSKHLIDELKKLSEKPIQLYSTNRGLQTNRSRFEFLKICIYQRI